VETFDERLTRFLDSRPLNIFGWMTVWAQNELVPQIQLVNHSGAEVLLFVGCHTFIQGFMEKTYDIRGKTATHEFLSRFMDGAAQNDKFSAISSEVHDMRNVMAHQIYSAATHNVAFDYRLKVGWDRVGANLHLNPKVFGDQFIAAVDGGRITKWRKWTTPDLLIRQKWRFIADWLKLTPKDPLRLAVESFAKITTTSALDTAEKILRARFGAKYGV